jgi:pimeloyl-ACP methyl ester carboxylesterase
MTQTSAAQPATEKNAIRPFQVNFPEEAISDLRRRINATKWPEQETVSDATQGVQLATMQKLARYWGTDYDWSKCEAKLKALPHFITEIDGLDIHFVHVSSKHENALPLIVTHGWPGSTVEQLKIIEPLTNPTANGGDASDAFHLVIPSMPGYGFSGKPTTTGWDAVRIARAWDVLMKRLGYTQYVAQGGDWGALISDLMGAQAPSGLLGIHTNMAGAFPADLDKAAFAGAPAPPDLSDYEREAYDRLSFFYSKGLAYALQMALRIHRSVLPRGYSITTFAATTSSLAFLMASPRVLPETISSTTSRSTGLRTRECLRRVCIGKTSFRLWRRKTSVSRLR